LHSLGAIVSLPAGRLIPEFLGRMTPPSELQAVHSGVWFRSPLGLGGGVDPEGIAIAALARFGFGFVEVGPYLLGGRWDDVCLPAPLAPGREPERLASRLASRPRGFPVWLRLIIGEAPGALEAASVLLDPLEGEIDTVTVRFAGRQGIWSTISALCRERGIRRVLVEIGVGDDLDGCTGALSEGAAGIMLRHAAESPPPEDGVEAVRLLRRSLPEGTLIVAGYGVRSPREIVAAFDAGADLCMLDTGFIEAGPGLAKRGNEALAGRAVSLDSKASPDVKATVGWPWIALLGIGMVIAGAVVLGVGITRVILPYDLRFLGVGLDQLSAINPRLLRFMRHDRVTLAGTMLSIGVLYAGLAWSGMRRGWRWARDVMLASGIVGFGSLFLFLGFHYVDPLHVAIAAVLFPLFVAGVLLPTRPRPQRSLDLDNDRTWLRGLAGQLLFAGLGFGLVVSGIVIASVGVTRVFVFSDLAFLQTSAGALSQANAHLLPLIAHDRAGFGGALASDGVAVLLLALWGFRRGEAWVWWTLLTAGLLGFGGGLLAHLAVGYLEFGHLLPLFVSGIVFLVALLLSFDYLVLPSPRART
jgi:hypothetical protein